MASLSYHVILTNRALTDLQALARHIRRDSPQSAALVATRIVEAIDSLRSMPSRFPRFTGSRKRGSVVRRMVVRPFVVYYRIDERTELVQVITISHGAQRQPRQFD